MSNDQQQPRVVIYKADKDAVRDGLTLRSNAIENEDEFNGMYETNGTSGGGILQPLFLPKRLYRITKENNSLGQCIAAMVTNIDGTGYAIEPKDKTADTEDDEKIKQAEEFFKEPYPRTSFTTMRKAMRKDLEATGQGYFELIRNAADEMVFLRHMGSTHVRKVRLGEPQPVRETVTRNGVEIEVTLEKRERKYVQMVGTKKVYFKEYGASRDLNKHTGEWAAKGQRLKAQDRATELLEFGVDTDPTTVYALPRWVPQIPSAMGSREAELLNLEFFDTGGIPPLMIFLAGGTLIGDGKQELKNLLSGKASDKMKGVVLETMPTAGSLDSSGNTGVTVERFGAEQQKDSMFEGYDEKCEKRVRASFRLPPLFVGKADDYSYATAFASYAIAETQVFAPERFEFDEVINNTIMRELGLKEDYCFRSMPLSVQDIQVQMDALGLIKGTAFVKNEDFLTTLNEVANLNLKFDEEGDQAQKDRDQQMHEFSTFRPDADDINVTGKEKVPPESEDAGKPQPSKPPAPKKKSDRLSGEQMAYLADAYFALVVMDDVPENLDSEAVMKAVNDLTDDDRDVLDNLLANKGFVNVGLDNRGMSVIAGCATEMTVSKCDGDH